MNKIVFTVAPTYTMATYYTKREAITMHEWIGKPVEKFEKAMGREPTEVRVRDLGVIIFLSKRNRNG